ncbi:hypothetical protein MHH52_16205 [Paenibacillus sp. FSL K6-0276]|uniref:hypothetical protein n=1 Tax=Paenibacillus sp. FSL K6-0276 TaxID=2921450 RepID=UPI0030EBE3BB
MDWKPEDLLHVLEFPAQDPALKKKNGCKILFEDGIYGEYVVFEEQELEGCTYSEGRIVWKKSFYENESIVKPMKQAPSLRSETIDREVNEALTNLYVGLGRYARGEKLSATRFVEGHAVDRLLSETHLLESEVYGYPDIFGNDRRFEAIYLNFRILWVKCYRAITKYRNLQLIY